MYYSREILSNPSAISNDNHWRGFCGTVNLNPTLISKHTRLTRFTGLGFGHVEVRLPMLVYQTVEEVGVQVSQQPQLS